MNSVDDSAGVAVVVVQCCGSQLHVNCAYVCMTSRRVRHRWYDAAHGDVTAVRTATHPPRATHVLCNVVQPDVPGRVHGGAAQGGDRGACIVMDSCAPRAAPHPSRRAVPMPVHVPAPAPACVVYACSPAVAEQPRRVPQAPQEPRCGNRRCTVGHRS
jgi:hypothetical protein